MLNLLLAQLDFDDLDGNLVWIVVVLGLSFLSWLMGKFKEWSEGRVHRRPVADHDEEEVVEMDLEELFGLPRQSSQPSGRETTHPPTARAPSPQPLEQTGPPPVARPATSIPPRPPTAGRQIPPTPRPIRRQPTPRPQPAAKAPPRPTPPVTDDEIVVLDVTDTPPEKQSSTTRASARRLGRLTRAELRRGIILAEVLGKPIALRDGSANN